ncbi:class I SAM-dependent methyltransferase [Piscinibacter sp.]|uniref:class I SAM-dependent methyltransferase n=1 Tax=Piscinibacter sp. TaxID=1903157 RepID=UPI002B6782B8|nr:class I SAM-dependent methyltransferase [Albitalea sp.]HUG24729.1 class I SAM-dependent methyltransferase [Albitalea sp.]
MSGPADDAGAALRALYQADGGATSVSSSKVDAYAARPDYPAALLDALVETGVLASGAVIADVGAGTGRLTRALLQRGHAVVAVEPSDAMRAAADVQLGAMPGYRSAAGSAEATTLPDSSVDLVTAAQAFHWFDIDGARREFRRILKPHGQVALIWNDRWLSDPLQAALDELFGEFGGAKRAALLAAEDRSRVPLFFAAAPIREIAVPHAHRLDRAGLRALVFSRSYMPAAESPLGADVQRRVDAVFDRFADAGAVAVRYRTVAFTGSLA